MKIDSPRVICVGTDPQLLATRKLVLEFAGFDALCVSPNRALEALKTSSFDVMIVSVSVSEADRSRLNTSISGSTRVVQLNSFIEPKELLALLEN